MKTFALVLRDEEERKNITSIIKSLGFEEEEDTPDFVVCVGGDGTVLVAERLYPSIPKLCFSKSTSCRTRYFHAEKMTEVLRKVKEGSYEIVEEMKLEAKFDGKTKKALNELQLHNKKPTHAIRFSVKMEQRDHTHISSKLGDIMVFENVVVDGIIISTPFGSTAYYYSAGGDPFDEGIGVAFNNPHNCRIRPFTVSEDSTILVTLERGDGLLIADNDENWIEIKEGERFTVKKSEEKARFIVAR